MKRSEERDRDRVRVEQETQGERQGREGRTPEESEGSNTTKPLPFPRKERTARPEGVFCLSDMSHKTQREQALPADYHSN